MGLNVQSSVTKQAIESVTNIVNKNITEVQTTAQQRCATINIQSTTIGGPELCGAATVIKNSTININQTTMSACVLDSKVYADILSDQITNIQKELQQEVTKQLENKQGWLAFAVNIQTSVSNVETQIRDNIDNIVETTINNTCEQTSTAYNKGNLVICSDIIGSTINVDQNAYVTATLQCTTTAIIKAIFNTTELQNIAQQTDEHFASEQEGIGSLFKWLVPLIIAIVIILVIGVIIYFVVSGGSGDDGKSKQNKQIEQMMLMKSMSGGSGGSSSSMNPALMASMMK